MAKHRFDDTPPTQSSSRREPSRYGYAGESSSRRQQSRYNSTRQPSGRRGSSSYGCAREEEASYRRTPIQPKRTSRKPIGILACLIALVVVAGGAYLFLQSLPASITLNGTAVEIGGSKTLADALQAAERKPQSGDLVAIDGSVLEEGKGQPFHATINGEATTDTSTKLASGDIVELGDGEPIEEPSETKEEIVPYTYEEQGNGPIHLIEGEGVNGVKQTKTGSISGLVTEEVLQESVNVVRRNVSPDVGDDKVVALTFDDGPWRDSSAAVLDVLAQHGAKATFFVVGNRIEGAGVDLVKRAADEGHQICSHSFDHAAGDGQSVNLGYMKPEDQVAEVEKGYEAIEAATGAEASHVFRTPGGNYGEDVMRNIGPLISAEIGWNIDSQDWRTPGAGAIAAQIKDAWPGAIVLMHDGGGDRSQTVRALKDALPYLKAQGYRFVTMDELLSYPLS